MHNKEQVDRTLDKLRHLLEKASDRIEAIEPGKKIPATELAQSLAEEIGKTGPQLYPVLLWLFQGYPGVDIRKGAHGGIYKLMPGEVPGQKKVKPVKTTNFSNEKDSENDKQEDSQQE